MKVPVLLAGLVLGVCAAQAAPPNMRPGMWEITTSVEMPGLPTQMPPQSIRHCYKAEDLKESRDTLPADKTCKVDEFRQEGNTVRWKMSCKGDEGPMSGSGEIAYAGHSYSGTVAMAGKAGGQSFNVTQKYSGRRIGDCN
ncbi:MAG: DUF3617 family protein [Betaproteobacteria bacterium]|nr:DUF3617 family protein [Betaproteobacteria bacterium]